MRPVNLIPAEERRGEQAPLRSGPLAYVLVGALVALLLGVTALVITNNQISDGKAEIADLERKDAAAEERAQRLAAYTQFQLLREKRIETVASLADSRFDWERVMRELSLVLPSDVWLISLEATASAEASVGGSSGGGGLRASAPGPALVMSGCTTGQESVAGFVTALEDIDGVTRVGVESSELSSEETGAGAANASGDGGQGSGSSSDCRTRSFIAKFQIVVAFDAAPVPASAAESQAPATPTEAAEATNKETEAESGASSGEGTEGGEG